jgi:hypothetical protein
LDPALQFNPILQKDLGKDGERDQNRGMATLDDRVQAVLYQRLHAYKVIDPEKHLPKFVPAAVVLNSGGSYRQLATWEYLKTARFVSDQSVKQPFLQVSGAPEYLNCNAIFMATTARLDGSVIYVSISPTELHGPPAAKQVCVD